MRYHLPIPSATATSGFMKTQSTQLSRAMERIARRSFYPASKNLNRFSEYSLPNSEIKDISRRAFSAISRQRPRTSSSVINVIKGKPHFVKLGQIDGTSTGFEQMFNDFYTNIYSDRVPHRVKMTLEPSPSKKICKDSSNFNATIKIPKVRRKLKAGSISSRLKSQDSVHMKQLRSIIKGCNDLLEFPRPGVFRFTST